MQNLDNVREASARLYESLQEVVDQQIQNTGFVPPDDYGMESDKNGGWNCSQKQRELIEKIEKENRLDQNALERLDIVGYSKLSINEQRAAIDELNEVVRASEQFQKAGSGSFN